MKVKFKINETLLAGIVAFAGLVVFSVLWNPAPDYFHCPNEYQTAEEYTNGVIEWISNELYKYPGITEQELLDKRTELAIEHECERPKWAGAVLGEPPSTIYDDWTIAGSIESKTYL